MSPWTIRNGGSSFVTYVIGLARWTLSLFSWMGPPISFDSGESGASWSILLGKLLIFVKSVGPKKSHNRLHPAGDAGVGADVEVVHVARRAEQGDQVPARRGTPDADAIGIDAVLIRVRPQPADRRLAVLDLGGEDRVLAEPIVDARDRVAVAR